MAKLYTFYKDVLINVSIGSKGTLCRQLIVTTMQMPQQWDLNLNQFSTLPPMFVSCITEIKIIV